MSAFSRTLGVFVCLAAAAYARGQALRKIDVDLLDEISRRSFHYFWEQASPRTSLVFDRAISLGPTKEYLHGFVNWPYFL